MTYQKPIPNYDNNADADAASSLILTIVTASPAPSFSLGQEGGAPATQKKNGVPTMRAMIVTTCFLLGTLAVIYGGRGSSSSHTRSGDLAAELLRKADDTSYNYDPTSDFCFTDTDTAGKYCWYPTDNRPCGNWKGEGGHGYNDCGRKCTRVLGYQDYCTAVVYDPHEDFCFSDEDNPGKYCWCPEYKIPYGNWRVNGDRGFNDCGSNDHGGLCTESKHNLACDQLIYI